MPTVRTWTATQGELTNDERLSDLRKRWQAVR
jgi:hypothetical protein